MTRAHFTPSLFTIGPPKKQTVGCINVSLELKPAVVTTGTYRERA